MKPPMVRRMVDFPHPEGPRKVTISPSYTFRLMCSTPSPLSYRFVMSLISSLTFRLSCAMITESVLALLIFSFLLVKCCVSLLSYFILNPPAMASGPINFRIRKIITADGMIRSSANTAPICTAELSSTIPYIATGMV